MYLAAHIPDWVERLEKFNNQVERRQRTLLTGPELEGTSAPTAKSTTNERSTEPLKPEYGPEAHPREATTPPEHGARAEIVGEQAPQARAERILPSAMQTLRRPQDSDSVVSAAPEIRAQGKVVVYDNYVLLFFGELINYIGAGRRKMQNAKHAQIKRPAELELCVENDLGNRENPSTKYDRMAPIAPHDDRDGEPEAGMSSVRFTSEQPMRWPRRIARTGPGSRGRSNLTFNPLQTDRDDLDKRLADVQTLCRHAAHQFLLYGNCAKDVANIKQRLGETKELANREMERERKDLELVKQPVEDGFRVAGSHGKKNVDAVVTKPDWCQKLDEAEESMSNVLLTVNGVVYGIGKTIGEGSFGIVFEGEMLLKEVKVPVAIKFVSAPGSISFLYQEAT